MASNQNRRALIKTLLTGSVAIGAASMMPALAAAAENINDTNVKLKGNVNHSVCQWCFSAMPLEELCIAVKEMGIGAIDLIGPKDWPMLQKYNLYSSMCYIGGTVSLTNGFNDKKYHDQLVKDYTETIPLMKKAGYKNLICFSGSRNGMDDETGLKNCAEGLQKILPLAEKNGITIQMELLNSKIDHKDYMCDRTAWGVELCKKTGSENFKLLYDIYHMQIDEGDVIRTIRDHHQYIGHYHTAGVPGRHELDDKQELNYPAIINAILATGFKDYIAQEFIPTAKDNKDKLAALKQAILLCDV